MKSYSWFFSDYQGFRDLGVLRSSAFFISFLLLLVCVPLFTQTSTPEPKVRLLFFLDKNINGKRDSGEEPLRGLSISSPSFFKILGEAEILVGENQVIKLNVQGSSNSGKGLVAFTLSEPEESQALPDIRVRIGTKDMELGLADGFLSSPLDPALMNSGDYEVVLKDPGPWERQCAPLYPPGWAYPKNYFFYGYRIPAGPLEGQAHQAFDMWALPGTPVLAGMGGVIVEGLYDWRFGIAGAQGTVYYNHLVPAVKIGQRVKRYELVGWIAQGEGNHLHFELMPSPQRLLSAFPGLSGSDLLTSPLRGERVRYPFF